MPRRGIRVGENEASESYEKAAGMNRLQGPAAPIENAEEIKMSLLELKNVSKIYGELKALDNVSLHVDQGEWVAIMGPSGSGKSTMMNIIGCMDKPTQGEVLLDGADIARESSRKLTEIRRDKIGLVFQQFYMVNYLTAVENVMVSQYYHSMPDEA